MTYDPNRGGMSRSALLVLFVFALFFGAIIWAYSGNRPSTSSTSQSPITTGQGRTNVTPGVGQNLPNPTPPAAPRSK